MKYILTRIFLKIFHPKRIVKTEVTETTTIKAGTIVIFYLDKSKYLYLGKGCYVSVSNEDVAGKYRINTHLYNYTPLQPISKKPARA